MCINTIHHCTHDQVKRIGERIKTYNMDGREFITKVIADDLRTTKHTVAPLVVMNLPGLAIDFLDVFSGLLSEGDSQQDIMVCVCCCLCID